jgi:hypothetical protein
VSFSAPKSDLPITSYTVTANPGGITATGAASPIVVPGLSSGVAYTFTVKATSNAGTGKPSSASNSVTPIAAQQAVAVRSTPAAAVAVAPAPVVPVPVPAVKPAAPVAAAPVAATQTSAPKVAAAVVAPIAAVTAVPVIVAPVIAAAVKPVAPVAAISTPAAPVPTAPTKVAAAQPVQPSNSPAAASSIPAPTIMAAKPGSMEARVFFTVPQGASALIDSYTVVAYTGNIATAIKASGTASPIKIKGLANGTDYTFVVFANGKSGTKVASVASNTVTPLGIFGD